MWWNGRQPFHCWLEKRSNRAEGATTRLPYLKTTAARMAEGRDSQWVPTQTRYNDVQFRHLVSKCGLRCQPDVVDQMRLPTALAFAIAAEIHVSHSSAIIWLRDPQQLRCCSQRSMLIEKFPYRRWCVHPKPQPSPHKLPHSVAAKCVGLNEAC
jgi:hypothetical protein